METAVSENGEKAESGTGEQPLSKSAQKKAAKRARMEALKKAKQERNVKVAKPKAGDGKRRSNKKDKQPAAPQYDLKTPAGKKKELPKEIPPSYQPKYVESSWYEWWVEKGYFKPTSDKEELTEGVENYCLVIPPPNVTGSLHIGHALTNAIQDCLARWHRMRGFNVLWIPGTDHAGIATQAVVEKSLWHSQKVSKYDLGRDAFVEQVWKWKEKYGNRINEQLRRLGSSLDWDREVFTMDEKRATAVMEAFVRFWNDGIIYRSNRLVNWDCTLKTAISDIEVEYMDIDKPMTIKVPGYDKQVEFGSLIHFSYALEDGSGELEVATTRIETMLGDTAVAVHPEDDRYKDFLGKRLVHPFRDENHKNKYIPVIGDSILVDMNFGTGAVKVTPAHDHNDFEVGMRHKLDFISIFDDDGLLNEEGCKFKGIRRFDARRVIEKELQDIGLLKGRSSNPMRIGRCQRTGDVIEPRIMPQWFVNCKEMARRSVEAVKDGSLEIVPDSEKATWYNWLENVRDWCISRQLWWGHRIPAYFARFEGETKENLKEEGNMDRWVAGRTSEEAEEIAIKKFGRKPTSLQQDEDVLDTWFSSALFPFSATGWPNEEDKDFKVFYPTTVLETGKDILFFWVARMVMTGFHLTDKLCFDKVLLHSMVRDTQGRKMSKTLGNVIDPIDVIEGISLDNLQQQIKDNPTLPAVERDIALKGQKRNFPKGIKECGADALRFALMAYMSKGKDINLDINRVVSYRQFCNKLWNATRFMLLSIGGIDFKPDISVLESAELPRMCSFILSRLTGAISLANKGLEDFELSISTSGIHSFFLYDYCDVFLEASKPIMRGEAATEQVKSQYAQTLFYCLTVGLKLLHPFMPFVTEELFQFLPKYSDSPDSIMIDDYPTPESKFHKVDPLVEEEFGMAFEVVKVARSLKSALGVKPSVRPTVLVVSGKYEILKNYKLEILTLSQSGAVMIVKTDAEKDPEAKYLQSHVSVDTNVYLDSVSLEGFDVLEVIGNVEFSMKKLLGEIEDLESKINGPNFDSTPADIANKMLDKHVDCKKKYADLELAKQSLDALKE